MEIKTLLFLTETRLGRLRRLSSPGELAGALEIVEADLASVLQQELFQRAVTPKGTTLSGAKRVREDVESAEAPYGGSKTPKTKVLGKALPLTGTQPCWSWILRRAGCSGGTCVSVSRKGDPAPRPHLFADVDKGKPEQAYRAWVTAASVKRLTHGGAGCHPGR